MTRRWSIFHNVFNEQIGKVKVKHNNNYNTEDKIHEDNSKDVQLSEQERCAPWNQHALKFRLSWGDNLQIRLKFQAICFPLYLDLIAFSSSLITLGLEISHNAIIIIHHWCFFYHNKGEDLTHYGSTVFEAREASPLNIISYGKYSTSKVVKYIILLKAQLRYHFFACPQWSLCDVWRQFCPWPKWRN